MKTDSVGTVFIPDDTYIKRLKFLSIDLDDWKSEYSKNGIFVHSKATELSQVKLFKVNYTYKDVPAATLFDTLVDSEYRRCWDNYMIDGYELCRVGPGSDIGYYSVKMLPGIKNRDFVMQRFWMNSGSEYVVASHSISHKAIPPQKQFIRAKAYLIAFVLRACGSTSCEMTYLCQCDPRGKLPVWFINKATQYVVPNVVKNLRKACLKYEAWKASHRPEARHWLYPEQSTLVQLDWDDILTTPENGMNDGEVIDETGVAEANDSEIDLE